MAMNRPEATGVIERDSWLFVKDPPVYHRPKGVYGYHGVQAAHLTVLLDWKQVFTHHFPFVPPDEAITLTSAYTLSTWGFTCR